MATATVNVASPRNGIPIGVARIGGQTVYVDVHPEYLRWFDSLVFRLGGTTGSTTTDLAVSSFEDAGIEENKIDIFRVSDEAGQVPPQPPYEPPPANDDSAQFPPAQLQTPDDLSWQLMPPAQLTQADNDVATEIEELRAQVAELKKVVEALQQGITA